jgi:RHS repeat-associated protein
VGASEVDEAEMRYKPWGEVRYTSGTMPTDYTYTGQRSEMDSLGLMFYNARWYDPALGRFTQADTIVPEMQGTQAWDRYAYVNNNPVLYSDPSGHCVDSSGNVNGDQAPYGDSGPCDYWNQVAPGTGEQFPTEYLPDEYWVLGEEADNLATAIFDLEETNVWDIVPGAGISRKYFRADEQGDMLAEQQGFDDEQAALQGWYNCSYVTCHDTSDSVQFGPQYPTIGGPMPDTPLVDAYSVAQAKKANAILTFATGRIAASNGITAMNVLKGVTGRVVTPYYDLFFGFFER